MSALVLRHSVFRDPATVFARGCPRSTLCTSFSSQPSSVLGLAQRRSSREVGATRVKRTLSIRRPQAMMTQLMPRSSQNGDSLAKTHDAADSTGPPATQDDADPTIPDAAALACSGSGNPVPPGADAPNIDGDPMLPIADAPMTSHACAPSVPGDVVLRRGSWC